MTDTELFLQHINDNYDLLKNKYKKFCIEKNLQWDDDIYADTILKCAETIDKRGKLIDNTPQGIENYLFMSFRINLRREKLYARVAARDCNLTTEEVNMLYEDYFNDHNDSPTIKLKNDLYIDFATLYICHVVDENFDAEHSYLFRLKYLCNLTYKQLADRTKIKGSRQKVITVRQWLKDNLTKEEINDAFNKMYDDLL